MGPCFRRDDIDIGPSQREIDRRRQHDEPQHHGEHELDLDAAGGVRLLIVDHPAGPDEAHQRQRNESHANQNQREAVIMAERA